MLYVYLVSGFKVGGIGDVYEVVNDRIGDVIWFEMKFDLEEVLMWELGVKLSFFDNLLNLKVVFFYIDYIDM